MSVNSKPVKFYKNPHKEIPCTGEKRRRQVGNSTYGKNSVKNYQGNKSKA